MLEKLRQALARDTPAFVGPRGYLTTALTPDSLTEIAEEIESKGKSEISVFDERGVMYLVRIMDARR